MNKKFTKLIAALALLVFMMPPMKMMATDIVVTLDNIGAGLGSTANTTEATTNITATSTSDIYTLNYYQCKKQTSGTSSAMFMTKSQNAYISNKTAMPGNIKSVQVFIMTGAAAATTYDCAFSTTECHSAVSGIGAVNITGGNNHTFSNLTGGAINVEGKYFCITLGNANNGQVLKLVITCEETPAYTITAAVNDATMGSATVSGSTITATPYEGYRVIAGADGYTVTSGSATVTNNGDDTFSVTPSSDCTVQINFEAIPTHTATFSVNGATSSQNYLEGASIEFPDDPANISGRKFVGWTKTTIAEPTDEEPSFVNTDTETMGNSNVTYYAVFAIATPGDPVETKTQTLQYDSWTYSGSTTDKTTYRLFHTDSYIESAAFDLSKLSKVIVYGGTFGGDSYNSLTIGDGTNIWKDVTVSGKSETGINTYTEGNALTGTNKLRVRSNSGTASSTGVRISKVEIYTMEPSYTYSGYCTSVAAYTITAVSNNADYGTVSLSGEVITGAPQSGCRYATPAYTVSPVNSATVIQDGNEFTVTPLANTTITINFELIPTYTLSSAVSPENAGTVTLGTSSGLLEGATVSAEAAANAGYKFTGWSISGTGATLSSTTDNPTTVTIGTANATVTANFEEVTTYAITYSVNGVTNTVNVEENTAVDFSAPNSALIPVGYVFKGWRTSAISTPTDTEPTDYVTSATSTADITYYAVMAVESFSPETESLTQSEITTNLTNTTCAYGTEKTFIDGDITWTISAYTDAANRPWMQLKKAANSYIKVEAPGKITELVFTITSATNSSGGITDITKHTDYSGYIYLEPTPKASPSGTLGSTNTVSSDQMTIVPTGNNSVVYMQVASGARVWGVEVSYSTTTTSGFCTSVSSVTLAEDVTIEGDLNVTTYTLTIPSGKTLAVNGTLICDDPANLIIEDGGQLYTEDVVEATIKKNISQYTIAANDDTDPDNVVLSNGWYFISYPLNCDYTQGGDAPTGVTNLITTSIYDLYLFDPEANQYGQENGEEWVNYKAHTSDFKLITGHGYLYANANNVTLEFAGSLNDPNPEISLEEGYNLVGNPYAYNAYPSMSYYKMNNNGTAITADLCSDVIPPCTGIIVDNSDGSVQEITFSKDAPDKSTNGNLNIFVAQEATNRGASSVADNAIVSFNEGSQLGKFYFGTQNANLYIPQGSEEYAIVSTEGQGEMPVNFKANENGQYTLTVNPENVEMNYLHLIDNMTGMDVDLLQTPSYTFNATTRDYESRFRLVFASNNEDGASTGSGTFAFYSNGNWIISNIGEATLQVVDVNGRILSSETVNGSVSKTINATPGVYMLRLINGDNVKVQKIVVR